MFKKKSDNDKIRAFIDGVMKDVFDAFFSAGWDAALKTLVENMLKQETQKEENELKRETQKEENELKWEAMKNGETD